MFGKNHFGCLKFLNQNWRQCRLHYVSGPTDTGGSHVRMRMAWGKT